jgi:hypothetical protein
MPGQPAPKGKHDLLFGEEIDLIRLLILIAFR